jgi:hypothetical protein
MTKWRRCKNCHFPKSLFLFSYPCHLTPPLSLPFVMRVPVTKDKTVRTSYITTTNTVRSRHQDEGVTQSTTRHWGETGKETSWLFFVSCSVTPPFEDREAVSSTRVQKQAHSLYSLLSLAEKNHARIGQSCRQLEGSGVSAEISSSARFGQAACF